MKSLKNGLSFFFFFFFFVIKFNFAFGAKAIDAQSETGLLNNFESTQNKIINYQLTNPFLSHLFFQLQNSDKNQWSELTKNIVTKILTDHQKLTISEILKTRLALQNSPNEFEVLSLIAAYQTINEKLPLASIYIWAELMNQSPNLTKEIYQAFNQSIDFKLFKSELWLSPIRNSLIKLDEIKKSQLFLNEVISMSELIGEVEDRIQLLLKSHQYGQSNELRSFQLINLLASKNYLKDASLVLKKVIAPSLTSENNIGLERYFLTLGRLLYQAKAYEQSSYYYSLISESSPFFLDAQLELMWVHFYGQDASMALGTLESFKKNANQDFFRPNYFLAWAVYGLSYCHYTDVKLSLDAFAKYYEEFFRNTKTQKRYLSQKREINLEHQRLMLAKSQVLQELKKMKKIGIEKSFISKFGSRFNIEIKLADQKNDQAIISMMKAEMTNVYNKMRLAKIELLAFIRKNDQSDIIRLNQAGIKRQNEKLALKNKLEVSKEKKDEVIFPYENGKHEVWTDELFHLKASRFQACKNII